MNERDSGEPLLGDKNWRRRFRRNLRNWYARHARDLPWRRTNDPYPIWISEIMLQQTTVSAVTAYFRHFLERFPTVADLAAASETEVLRYWEGLGYYSRARNIHKAARQIVEEHGGRFPNDVDSLRKLPGIGRYTAGAIASFAFDRPAPIVEANTLRLYCRLLGRRGDPRSAEAQRLLWQFAEEILPSRQSGQFNQALMELGATVCTPSEPDCPQCPVRTCCRAFAEGIQNAIPRRANRPETTSVTEAAVVVHRRGTFLLHRLPEGERWAGLWDFPRFPVDGKLEPAAQRRRKTGGNRRAEDGGTELKAYLENRLAETTRLHVDLGDLLTEIRHSVTRYRIRLLCFRAECRSGKGLKTNTAETAWVPPDEFGAYPLSVTGRKIARLIAGEEG